MKRKLFVVAAFSALIVLQAIRCDSWAGGGSKNLVSQGEISLPGYPRIIGFRVSDSNGVLDRGKLSLLRDFDVLHGNDVARNPEFREAAPKAILIAHWRTGVAFKNPKSAGIKAAITPKFSGHWLLYNGSMVSQSVSASRNDTTIHVSDTRVFSVENKPNYRSDDLMIYVRNEDGTPNWGIYEHCILTAIDHGAKTIMVKRGQYGTAPAEFVANRAVVATHATSSLSFWIEPKLWRMNFSMFGPRDDVGLLAAERTADIMAQELTEKYVNADGVEFDVGEWSGRAATANDFRGLDIDNDLVRDDGFINVKNFGIVNAFGLGTILFFQRLRENLGANYIIQSEGEWRGFAFGNGLEVESYPVFPREPWDIRQANERFERCRFAASRMGYQPRMSYLYVKRPTETYSKSPVEFQKTDRFFRMGFASAMMIDGFISYSSVDDSGVGRERGLGFEQVCWWDEYSAGKFKKLHYLGQPLGPATFFENGAEGQNLLGGGGPRLEVASGYKASLKKIQGGTLLEVTELAQKPDAKGIRLIWPMTRSYPKPYTLRMKVRANPRYGSIDKRFEHLSRLIYARIPGRGEVKFLADDKTWDLTLVLTTYKPKWVKGKIEKPELHLEIGEEIGSVEVKDISLCPGDGFAMWRRFENGLVLLNGTDQNVEFDLAHIDPGRTHRLIPGEITPDVNTGEAIRGRIGIGPYDGRVLLAE